MMDQGSRLSVSRGTGTPLRAFDPTSPTAQGDADAEGGPRPGTALCLSGGGYRAMLFHLGALWRLNELGWLRKLDLVSSVSGGAITAGALALAWPELAFGNDGVSPTFQARVVEPLRGLAAHTIDVWSVLSGGVSPASIGERVAEAYDRHLFHGDTLQNLPDEQTGVAPRFVFNASNVQSGALWRFSKPSIRDWRVGRIDRPQFPLARAVAASSAFPPFLSPMMLSFQESDYAPGSGEDLQRPPYTTRPVLTDGGVYDNLGLETAWKRYRTILVSDGGQKVGDEGHPRTNWFLHMLRVLHLVDNQVRSLRKRQLMGAFELPRDGGAAWRAGTYWGIGTDIAKYGQVGALDCPHEKTQRLAAVRTRLGRLDDVMQERLINWGYAVCDAAMRRWVLGGGDPAPAPRFPYDSTGVG